MRFSCSVQDKKLLRVGAGQRVVAMQNDWALSVMTLRSVEIFASIPTLWRYINLKL